MANQLKRRDSAQHIIDIIDPRSKRRLTFPLKSKRLINDQKLTDKKFKSFRPQGLRKIKLFCPCKDQQSQENHTSGGSSSRGQVSAIAEKACHKNALFQGRMSTLLHGMGRY